MSGSGIMVEVIKRELKSRGMTYGQLAIALSMSEAGVKRMFAAKNFTLDRLDQICEVLELDFLELTRRLSDEDRLIARLTWAQEEELVADKKLLLVAVCVLNLINFEQITTIYRLSPTECQGLLTRLDQIGFLELQPGNRIRLLIARTFHWIPDGPISQYIKSQIGDYFDDPFDGTGEIMQVINVRISREARSALLARLQQVAREYSDQHNADAKLPLSQRHAVSVLFAVRSWEPIFMRELRRLSNEQLAAYLKSEGKIDALGHT